MKTTLSLAFALALAAGALPAETSPAEKLKSILEEGLETRIVLIADTSGSMASPPRSGGRPKIEQARQALSEFVAALPASMELGLICFSDCNIRWLVPLGKSTRDLAMKEIAKLTPGGRTPIADSLKEAEEALLPSIKKNPYARNVLVLVTDGEETCASVATVKRTAAKLSREMMELTVIGFDLDSGESYLKDLGAQYFRANDYAGLRKGLSSVEAELAVGK